MRNFQISLLPPITDRTFSKERTTSSFSHWHVNCCTWELAAGSSVTLIYLCACQASGRWVADVVDLLFQGSLVLTLLLKPFPGHHDGHRTLGHKVVGEGAKNNAVVDRVLAIWEPTKGREGVKRRMELTLSVRYDHGFPESPRSG